MVDAKIAPKEETKDAGPAEIDKVETKRKKPDKDDYLRNAETEEYADDSERYKMKVTREERALRCERLFPDDIPPPLWAEAAKIEGKGDSWNRWVYNPPATIMFDVGAAQSGTGAFEGNFEHSIRIHNAHAITPETATTTHHFWSSARDFGIDNPETEREVSIIRKVFQEDVAICEAQQRTINRFPNAPQIDVAMDHPTIQARNLLERLIKDD